ncbi:MAG: hypothetical protein ACRDJG_03220 [Actinomycetota bacterium]
MDTVAGPESGETAEASRASSRSLASTTLSPKVGAAALGSAISIIVGIAMPRFFGGLSTGEVASLTGATATILSFVFGYLISDPLRKG